MRLRPLVATVAMLALLGGGIRWMGGAWLHVVIVIAGVVLFSFLLTLVYRKMYDDDGD